jgi:hypothetical protein
MTKQEWIDWNRNPVTEEFKKEVLGIIEEMAATVLNSREVGQQDCWYRGYIKGVQQLLEYRPEDFTDEV